MSADDYTPTTNEVAQQYVEHFPAAERAQRHAEFDRWLATVSADRRVAPDRETVIEALFYEDHGKHVFKYADPRLLLEDDSYLQEMVDSLASGVLGIPTDRATSSDVLPDDEGSSEYGGQR